MTTVRVARRRQYVQMDRRSVNDPALSFRARGVLAWLLEKPDNWTISAEAIASHGTEGRDAIRSALRELEAGGYLVRRKHRGDDGKWHAEAVLYEHPEQADQDGKPALVTQRRETSDGNPGLLLKTSTQDGDSSAATAARPGSGESGTDQRVKGILDAVWARFRDRGDKPPANYLAARGVVRKLVAAGWDDAAVIDGCVEAPTISTGAVEMVLRRRRPRRGTSMVGPSAALTDDEDARRRALPAGEVSPEELWG